MKTISCKLNRVKVTMQQMRQIPMHDRPMKKVRTVFFVLFFILIPVLAIPVNIYSAPNMNTTKGLSLLYGLLSDGSPLLEGFSYWKKEYPSIKDWFKPQPGTLSRLNYYEKLSNDRSKVALISAVANSDHISPLNVSSLPDNQSLAIDRVYSVESFQQVEAPVSSGRSSDKFDRWSILNTNYTLLAFGLIGYIVIRRRANV